MTMFINNIHSLCISFYNVLLNNEKFQGREILMKGKTLINLGLIVKIKPPSNINVFLK